MQTELLNNGISGLNNWKERFIYKTILIALVLSSFCIFCFYFYLEKKHLNEIRLIKERYENINKN